MPPELLGELDLVIASVHQRFQLGEDAATARLVAMMRQPFFKIWGHALGRLVMRREPIKVRLAEVLDACAESGRAAIEINGDPHRPDLAPEHARDAPRRAASSSCWPCDAHSINNLDYMHYAGPRMARRARLRPRDVLERAPARRVRRRGPAARVTARGARLPPDELAAAVKPRA